MPPVLPGMLDVFSAEVIPLLQRRELFHRAYDGKTVGLSWPTSVFDGAPLHTIKFRPRLLSQ
jgi:hypothetical protein